MGNTWGDWFRVTTFGESHGPSIGCIIDGCPAGYSISIDHIQKALDRRRPGQSHLSTPRSESDQVQWLSGLVDGVTLGTPLALVVANNNQIGQHYNDLKSVYRPSHADYTTDLKYGLRAWAGGGRASARETVARVAAGAVATQVLQQIHPDFEIKAWVQEVKGLRAEIDVEQVTRDAIEANPLRCPSSDWRELEKVILQAKNNGDSVGGVIYCSIQNPPKGLGDPVFDKLEANLAKAMMSLPASKGFELGSGFAGTSMYGSEHNDAFEIKNESVTTRTNNSGGIQGGISNGETIYFRVAFKPVATIFKSQDSVDNKGQQVLVKPKQGRHDPCVLPRAVPIVEAMAALTMMDHFLCQASILATRKA